MIFVRVYKAIENKIEIIFAAAKNDQKCFTIGTSVINSNLIKMNAKIDVNKNTKRPLIL
jgi:hypothetical protein